MDGSDAERIAIDDLIARLDRWLRDKHPESWSARFPGATTAELDDVERMMNAPLPVSFRRFYQYANPLVAVALKGDGYDFDNLQYGCFLDLKGCLQEWDLLNRVTSSDTFEDLQEPFDNVENWWNAKWLPFMDFGTGDCLCVDLFGSFGGNPGQVVKFIHDTEMRVVEFSSFLKLVEAQVYAWENLTAEEWENLDIYRIPRLIDRGYPKFFPAEKGTEEWSLGIAQYPFGELFGNT